MGGGGGPSSLEFLQGVGLGRCVKFLIYIFGRGGGGSGQPGTLWLHPCSITFFIQNNCRRKHYMVRVSVPSY